MILYDFNFVYYVIYVYYRESVATPDDLYIAIENVLMDNYYEIGNKLTVQEFMSNWTTQAGYPLLNITKNETINQYLVTQVIKHLLY